MIHECVVGTFSMRTERKFSVPSINAMMAMGTSVPLCDTPTSEPMKNANTINKAPINPAAVPACCGKGETALDCVTGKLIPCDAIPRNIAITSKIQCEKPSSVAIKKKAPAAKAQAVPMRRACILLKVLSIRRQIKVPVI